MAVGLALIPPIEHHVRWVPNGFLWAAVVLTVVTGAQYFLDARAVSIRQLPAA
jgi:hypothetical protein